MLVIGIAHFKKSDLFLAKNIRTLVAEENFQAYQKGLVFPYLLLGILMICMGIVEKNIPIQTSHFVSTYLILAMIPITLLLFINKKYTNQYIPWIKNNK